MSKDFRSSYIMATNTPSKRKTTSIVEEVVVSVDQVVDTIDIDAPAEVMETTVVPKKARKSKGTGGLNIKEAERAELVRIV